MCNTDKAEISHKRSQSSKDVQNDVTPQSLVWIEIMCRKVVCTFQTTTSTRCQNDELVNILSHEIEKYGCDFLGKLGFERSRHDMVMMN